MSVMVDPRIGFMQGRLSPMVDGKIQAFPWSCWKNEFALAKSKDFGLMEWTLDHDRLQENPLMTREGQKQIKELCQMYNVQIPSLTGDFLMQEPFFKKVGQEREDLFQLFLKVIEACGKIGIRIIVFPLVDNGRLETKEQQDILVNYLSKTEGILKTNNVKICFEIDLAATEVDLFIRQLTAEFFAINYDIGNSAALGYDYHQELKMYGGRIANVHVKDRPLGGTTVPLGEGNADIGGVLRSLRSLGYQGNYILQTARSQEGKHLEVLCRYRDIVKTYVE